MGGTGVAVVVFIVAAAVVWVAGVRLSGATEILSRRLGLGSALGGLVLLAIATNLPEIAIVVSAGISGKPGVATGNILGGIAIQTVVLAVIDGAVRRREPPLTNRARSLVPVIEGVTVVAVLGLVFLGAQLRPSELPGGLDPVALLIVLAWVGGLWLVREAPGRLTWQVAERDDRADRGGGPGSDEGKEDREAGPSTRRAATVFGVAAVATLAGGVALERSGDAIAGSLGLSGVLFGATVLALATSLPEISTGIAAARDGDDALAIGDIFGGNAFLPVLFLPLGLLTGAAVLPGTEPTDRYLTALAMLLTITYVVGLLFRPKRRALGLGIDSLVVVVLYGAGIVGLAVAVAR